MEISIMKQVGATPAFIRFPFFIEGMFIGVLAGVAACFLTKITYSAVVELFAENLTIWQILGLVNIIQFDNIFWWALLFNCVAGALISALGTVFSMGKYLKV
jgi:cell division transport system permease protein